MTTFLPEVTNASGKKFILLSGTSAATHAMQYWKRKTQAMPLLPFNTRRPSPSILICARKYAWKSEHWRHGIHIRPPSSNLTPQNNIPGIFRNRKCLYRSHPPHAHSGKRQLFSILKQVDRNPVPSAPDIPAIITIWSCWLATLRSKPQPLPICLS